MTDAYTDDKALRLGAYLDGELDAAGAIDFERSLAGDAGQRRELARMQALRAALRGGLAPDRVSESFRAKIARLAAPAPARRAPESWRALAASAVVAAGLASAATWFAAAPDRSEAVALAVEAGHLRGLVSGQSVDVVSSDRHTVKPWFNGRLAAAPPVVDLAAQGFTLKGGRVDIIGGEPAPTLVYEFKKHVISLTALPPAQGGAGAPAQRVINGFSMLAWQSGGFAFWAVSDTGSADLSVFAEAFRAAAAAQ